MRFFAVLLILVLPLTTHAQKDDAKAEQALRAGDMAKAKMHIDQFFKGENNATDAKQWVLKGDIYYGIALSTEKLSADLKENATSKAYDAYKKAIELEPNKKSIATKVERNLPILSQVAIGNGLNYYNDKLYEKAIAEFKTSASIDEQLGQTNGMTLFNIGLSYDGLKELSQSVGFYRKAKSKGYKPETCCSFIVSNLSLLNKQEEAENELAMCRKEFPKNNDLLNRDLNLQLQKGNFEQAQNLLIESKLQAPDNAIIYYTSGYVNEVLKNSAQAELDYKKAIELNSGYFEAYYSLGVLYFNLGADIIQTTAEITDDKQYAVEKEKGLGFLKRAKPYLEKAHTLKSEDINPILALQQVYINLGDEANYLKMKEKQNKLGY